MMAKKEKLPVEAPPPNVTTEIQEDDLDVPAFIRRRKGRAEIGGKWNTSCLLRPIHCIYRNPGFVAPACGKPHGGLTSSEEEARVCVDNRRGISRDPQAAAAKCHSQT